MASTDGSPPAELRAACAHIAAGARSVRIDSRRLDGYAAQLAPLIDAQHAAPPDPEAELLHGSREERTAFWLCLDAINFGSGWFGTLRKRPGRSGYFAVAIGLRESFGRCGAPTAEALLSLDAGDVAGALGQDPAHPLMPLFAGALRDLGTQVAGAYDGRFTGPLDAAGSSAVRLVATLARWPSFADAPVYDGLRVPFLKRAQLTAADLHRAGVARFDDIRQLTIFADNLVPHVLRVDGILRYSEPLARLIEDGHPLAYGSPEEIEIRACALHAVELLVSRLHGVTAFEVDQTLWNLGQGAEYRKLRRHRTRCTAY